MTSWKADTSHEVTFDDSSVGIWHNDIAFNGMNLKDQDQALYCNLKNLHMERFTDDLKGAVFKRQTEEGGDRNSRVCKVTQPLGTDPEKRKRIEATSSFPLTI